MDKYILITGGCGYIGSHITLTLKEKGYAVIVVDNLSTGYRQNMLDDVLYYIGDIGDPGFLETLFNTYNIVTVIHLAAKTLVEESMDKPGLYYEENTIKSIALMKACGRHQVKHFIFSSTAAVYAQNNYQAVSEDGMINPSSVYGKTKYVAELALHELARPFGIKLIICRYFNVVGHHYSLKIGNYNNTSSALIPKICRNIANGHLTIAINGNDYNTRDGTSVRDYIHVMDIAHAHHLFLERMGELCGTESMTVNIGYGVGLSILEVIKQVNVVIGENALKYTVVDRRSQDIAYSVADNTKIKSLGWCPMIANPYTAMISSEIAWTRKHFSSPRVAASTHAIEEAFF